MVTDTDNPDEGGTQEAVDVTGNPVTGGTQVKNATTNPDAGGIAFEQLNSIMATARRKNFQAIPTEFWKPIDRALLPNPYAFSLINDYDDVDPLGDKGLLCFGSTGTGKTRAAICRMLEESVNGGIQDFRFIRMVDFASTVRRLAFKSSEALFDYTQSLTGDGEDTLVDCLFIDDFHMAKLTPRFGEELFSLVDHFTSNGLKLFATCQMTGDRLVRKLTSDNPDMVETARAIVRRLRDFCVPIDFDYNPGNDAK